MILVTVGAQMPFPRLVEIVDKWAASSPDVNVLAQIGEQDPPPHSIDHIDLLAPDALRELIADADLVVAHAGMGTIITCLDLGTPLVIFPREGARRETRNDHQLATVRRFRERPGIWVATTEDELIALLDDRATLRTQTPAAPETSPGLLAAIRSFVDA